MRNAAHALPLVLAIALGATLAAAQRPRTASIPRLFRGGDAPVSVGPAPRGAGGTDAAACADCHAEIAREWRGSQHARAWTDDVFQAAYAIEPMAFCRNCHAPLAARNETRPRGEAARDGVSCSVCHVRAGTVMGEGAGRGDAPGRAAPHPVLAVRAFAESRYCAGCHQFDFPGDAGPHRGTFASDEPMQDTFEEWSMSTAAAQGVQCQGCHMPWREGSGGRRWRSHAFPGSGDPAMLRSAVTVSVAAERRGDEIVVTATVAPAANGHSFPTGDLFRRAELVAWVEGDDPGARSAAFARDFANVLERDPHGALVFVRRQSGDTRVPPPGMGPPRVVTLRLRAPAGTAAARVRWSFDYLLMPTPLAASQGFGRARNRTAVHTGELSLAARAPDRSAP